MASVDMCECVCVSDMWSKIMINNGQCKNVVKKNSTRNRIEVQVNKPITLQLHLFCFVPINTTRLINTKGKYDFNIQINE